MKNLTMETVADMAGVRAKETDKVSVEFTKKKLETNILALKFIINRFETWNKRSTNELSDIVLDLENAHPNWKF